MCSMKRWLNSSSVNNSGFLFNVIKIASASCRQASANPTGRTRADIDGWLNVMQVWSTDQASLLGARRLTVQVRRICTVADIAEQLPRTMVPFWPRNQNELRTEARFSATRTVCRSRHY